MDRITGTVLVLVAALLIGGFVVLAALHDDPAAYAQFLGTPAVVAVIGAVIYRRAGHIQRDVAEVKYATNGQLSEQFEKVAEALDDASVERKEIAADAPNVAATHWKQKGQV